MIKLKEIALVAIFSPVLFNCLSGSAWAASFNVQVFATGGGVGATSPDPVVFGDGSVWVAYQNGADSTGASGSSTVVRYTPSGTILRKWSIAGNVDGLRVDPGGLVWAMQNNDGNSALTVINPLTNATTAYSYGTSYTANGNSATRGFDDAAFLNGEVFMSETNPSAGTDPTVVRLTTGLSSPLQIAGILNSTFTGTNLATGAQGSATITDSDSLILTPGGNLALTGEADKTIVFVQHPGTANQTESFLSLLGTNHQAISGKPDDTIYPTAAQGFIYLADTGANIVYRITAAGLSPNSVYIDVGNEFGSLDTSTGVVTPILTGVSPHGAEFVTFAETGIPEPASLGCAAAGLGLCATIAYRRRRRMA
ncbi:MAG: hypothetical protein JO033_16820 [Acidobacteriaceae bacterium]|nr:hypothetical protein [Acidobacteriaceae bacterium]